MARKAPKTATSSIDFFVGFVIGMTAILFFITALIEITGHNALLWASLLAVSVALLSGLLLRRGTLQRRALERIGRSE